MDLLRLKVQNGKGEMDAKKGLGKKGGLEDVNNREVSIEDVDNNNKTMNFIRFRYIIQAAPQA